MGRRAHRVLYSVKGKSGASLVQKTKFRSRKTRKNPENSLEDLRTMDWGDKKRHRPGKFNCVICLGDKTYFRECDTCSKILCWGCSLKLLQCPFCRASGYIEEVIDCTLDYTDDDDSVIDVSDDDDEEDIQVVPYGYYGTREHPIILDESFN